MTDQQDKLEIAKLEADLEKSKSNNRYQLLATFFGTFLVSVIGSYLVFVQNTQKNLQDFDGSHRDFVSKFVDIAIDEDIEKRQRLARYFASVTLDEAQRSRWKEYSKYIDTLIEENPKKIAELRQNLNTANELEREALEARIKFLEKQLNPSVDRANVQTQSSIECMDRFDDYPARWRCIALRELNIGVKEVPGAGSNPRILDYAEFAAPDSPFRNEGDDIPWSGLFIAWVVAQSGVNPEILPSNPYSNRSWLGFGSEVKEPTVGVISIFSTSEDINSHRTVAGFYDSEDENNVYIISGNVNDAVSKVKINKTRLISYRSLFAEGN